jgi:hypothetical protein
MTATVTDEFSVNRLATTRPAVPPLHGVDGDVVTRRWRTYGRRKSQYERNKQVTIRRIREGEKDGKRQSNAPDDNVVVGVVEEARVCDGGALLDDPVDVLASRANCCLLPSPALKQIQRYEALLTCVAKVAM